MVKSFAKTFTVFYSSIPCYFKIQVNKNVEICSAIITKEHEAIH